MVVSGSLGFGTPSGSLNCIRKKGRTMKSSVALIIRTLSRDSTLPSLAGVWPVLKVQTARTIARTVPRIRLHSSVIRSKFFRMISRLFLFSRLKSQECLAHDDVVAMTELHLANNVLTCHLERIQRLALTSTVLRVLLDKEL